MRLRSFTLIESLIAMVVMAVVLAMLYQVMFISESSARTKRTDTDLRIERALLINQIQLDLEKADSIGWSGSTLTLSAKREVIQYSISEKALQRTKNTDTSVFSFPVERLSVNGPWTESNYPWPCLTITAHASEPWGKLTFIHHMDAKDMIKMEL